MLKTAPINIRTHPRVKKEAQKIADQLGLNLSTVLDAYLRQFIRTKEVYFHLRPEQPSKWLKETLRKSEEEYKRGETYTSRNAPEALAFLDKKIGNKKGGRSNAA